MLRVATSLASFYLANSLETYQFPEGHDPYRWLLNFIEQPRPTHTHIRQDRAPIEGHILCPNATGKYPWIDVQHGFLGEFPEMVYSEWLAELSNLGFIVTYGMPHKSSPHEWTSADNFTAWNEWNNWVRENANDVLKEVGMEHDLDLQIDTDYLGLICHADGCDMTKEYMIQNPDRAQGYFFLDPVYSLDNVDTKVNLKPTQSVIVAQSDMCTRCCESNEDFTQRTFDSISGMEIKTNQLVYEKGHCSAFNYWFVDNCRKGKYCNMPRDNMQDVRKHHRNLSGWVTAQMTYSFFDRRDMKKWFTETNRMPAHFLTGDEIVCESDAVLNAC